MGGGPTNRHCVKCGKPAAMWVMDGKTQRGPYCGECAGIPARNIFSDTLPPRGGSPPTPELEPE